MLRIVPNNTLHSVKVSVQGTLEPVFVVEAESEEAEEGLVHVTEVTGISESSCRILDKIARQEFIKIDPVPGTIHLLESPAGSGKTASNIELARNVVRKTGRKVLQIAFNRAAVLDGEKRCEEDTSITWKTIDSLCHSLYKEQLKSIPLTDIDDLKSLTATAARVLETPLFAEDVEVLQEELAEALNTGDPSRLIDEGLELYTAAITGSWWCYSSLRLRALSNPKWIDLFAEYDLICIDEAQDLAAIMFQLFQLLHTRHCVIYTLDSAQKIYRFMNCISVGDELVGTPHKKWRFYLTFRHGPMICDFVMKQRYVKNLIYSGLETPETRIELLDDNKIIPGKQTVIVSSWRNGLFFADMALNDGYSVRFDDDKLDELKTASHSIGWSKHDKGLFKYVNKAFIADVTERMTAEADILVTTVHGAKGLQWGTVRVLRCVIENKKRESDTYDDTLERRYVAVTRCINLLILPSEKKRKSRAGK